MDKQDIVGYKLVYAEISKTRVVFAKLEDFFNKADENISNDLDDPRDGIGVFPGLDRLMYLIPCVMKRLEEDVCGDNGCGNDDLIIDGLQAIKEGVDSVLIYYFQDDVGGAFNLLSNATSNIEKVVNKRAQSCIRYFRDLERITPDFQILLYMFDGFQETKRMRPEDLSTAESWSAESWLGYYLEKARLEEPLIAMVDEEGLSEASLKKGMELMIKESNGSDSRNKRLIDSYRLMKNRDAVFRPENPYEFLELSVIPDVKDENDGDYEVRTVDLHYEMEDDEDVEPWASSLPELQNWNENKSELAFDDSDLSHNDFEDDPVYQLLEPFVHNVMDCLKKVHLQRVKESGKEELRSPLEHYLVILALKSQIRISSCGVSTESVGHEAPRKGVYMFAMECLERFAEAIERFSQEHLYHLAGEARGIKKQIGVEVAVI